jgi:hypothetical protein
MQLFHTALEYAGITTEDDLQEGYESLESRIDRLSLIRYLKSSVRPEKAVFSEAHPPQNVLKIMKSRAPSLIGQFNSGSVYRAAFDQGGYKLVRAEGVPDRLYDLEQDPGELHPDNAGLHEARRGALSTSLERFFEQTEARRPTTWSRKKLGSIDEKLANRLRALGYLD